MDLHQQREQELLEHLQKDYKLHKKIVDTLRYEDDPKKQEKLNRDIEDLNITIKERENQLSKLDNEKRQKEKEAIAREMPSVTFDELDVVTKFILGMQPAAPETNFSLTDITQKISKNHLTQEVHSLITMGMGKVKDVGRFIEHSAILRPEFPEKLTAGFLMEYQKLLNKGITGDDLFESLRQFSCGNSSNFRKAAAGLAVLSYLFEKCEVFER
ncbi:hypothetical protein SD80_010265 [Scytonema tolypothrichoides VB-61278]|nr:hypothetical protein SD80_010265 [Scytonema tolypothrichoides VB-61278]